MGAASGGALKLTSSFRTMESADSPIAEKRGAAAIYGLGGDPGLRRLGTNPGFRLAEKGAHLGEEDVCGRSARLELLDPLEPGEHGAGLVHANDASGDKRARLCRTCA